jgi:hypothetical protein
MKKILCFDIDGVICRTKKSNYYSSKPIIKNINFINYLYSRKYYIKIFTSRYMGRNNEDSKKATKQGYNFTKKKLEGWGLKFNKLIFGKPSFDIIIDDKALNFRKNWILDLKKKLSLKFKK